MLVVVRKGLFMSKGVKGAFGSSCMHSEESKVLRDTGANTLARSLRVGCFSIEAYCHGIFWILTNKLVKEEYSDK